MKDVRLSFLKMSEQSCCQIPYSGHCKIQEDNEAPSFVQTQNIDIPANNQGRVFILFRISHFYKFSRALYPR